METASATGIESKAASSDGLAQVLLAYRLEREGREGEARELLRFAADRGSADAKAALAARLVSRPPISLAEGASLARQAADAGHLHAAHFLAFLVAEGLGVPQDWRAAFVELERAATLGHVKASAELAALSGNWVLARAILEGTAPRQDWNNFRQNIDIARLLAVPSPTPVSLSPRIALVQRFLTADMCDWLIGLARPELQRAKVVDPHTGSYRADDVRDNSAIAIDAARGDVLLALVRARIAAATRLPLAGFEETAILHYGVGEQFRPHHDYLDPNAPGYGEDLAGRGQRVVTFLIYLNEGFEGGETGFPALKTQYKGRKGDALFFWNVGPDGVPDTRTLHAGLPPVRGEKWLLSQWIRYRL